MKSTYEELRRIMKYIGDPDIDAYVKDRLAKEKSVSFWFGYLTGICMSVLVAVSVKLLF